MYIYDNFYKSVLSIAPPPSLSLPAEHMRYTEELKNALRLHLLPPEKMQAMGYPMHLQGSRKAYYIINPLPTTRTLQKTGLNIYVPEFIPGHYRRGSGRNFWSSATQNYGVCASVQRTCERCKQIFNISPRNFYVSEDCVYHWGRVEGSFGHRRHSCCYAPVGSPGCSLAPFHVHRSTMPGYNGPLDGYVRAYSSRGGVYALDAEMIYTTAGMELARVAVVAANGQTVYEALVQPSSMILDFNTIYSGISASDMMCAVKTLRDVQRDILQFVGYDTILVGHALDNDLRALKLIHGAVIDTCDLYPDKRGLPFRRGLRVLTKEYLGRDIQQGHGGHAPAEDARAAMELALLAVRTCSSYRR